MKKQETYAVRFVLRNSKVAQNEKSSLSVRVTVNAQRVEMSLGWYLTESLWDEKMQKCKGMTREAKGTNGFIDATLFRLSDIRQRLIIEGKGVTADFIKARYKGLPDPDEIPNPTILELYEIHNNKLKELIDIDIAKATYKRHTTSKSHIKAFIKYQYGKDDLELDRIDYKFLKDYEHYFKVVRKCNHNSTMKYIKNLGKVIRLGLAEGYMTKNPFDKFKLTYKTVQRDILTIEEVDKLVKLKIPEERLDRVRDLFVFCIYTGLAFVDVTNLKMEHLVKTNEGTTWIKNSRYKTSVAFLIPLLAIPVRLIKKYEGFFKRDIDGSVMPTLSNQKYNSYLKELAIRAKISKNLTSHLARHTFATTITLNEGVPLEVVSKMLGHSDTKTTQIYAKIQEKAIMNGMKKLMDKVDRSEIMGKG
jgi:site-specific recombinase XerD